MLHKRRSFGARKVSPPQPTCMTDEQKATYLSSLRNNRPARPGGARPLPSKPTTIDAENTQSLPTRSGSALSVREERGEIASKRRSIPNSTSLSSLKGRPLVHPPPAIKESRALPALRHSSSEIKFRESASRELEKQEAHSLRQALERIDHHDDEARIYTAAHQEASDLVWKHMNPKLAEIEVMSAYRNPDLDKKTKKPTSTAPSAEQINNQRQPVTQSSTPQTDFVEPLTLSKRESRDSVPGPRSSTMHSGRRRSSGARNASGGSNKGVFRNPEDQIYEEPEEVEAPATKQELVQDMPLRSRPGNPLLRGSRPLPGKPHTVPLPDGNKLDRFEIHRNPPTQSRNAAYTANASDSREATPEIELAPSSMIEIRSDDIRAATSMRRKDRSPNLPTPTAVSDRPGRPIVSFDPAWRSKMEASKSDADVERPPPRPVPSTPSASQSAPAVPTINLPDVGVPDIKVTDDSIPSISVPAINLPDDPQDSRVGIPSINLPEDRPAARPLPQITAQSDQKPRTRPLPSHSQSSPSKLPPNRPVTNRVPWLSRAPQAAGATVTCNACQLPISGRIVTASGSTESNAKVRFHPECFTCHHCSTALECVSFYPEPESARDDRLERQGPDADPSEMRFYCHLDFHDLFSPRCASCKTPIEGAVILAAGKSWHEGHFFCAECGDPFSSSSPFVEDRGYAYCVSCHTKRTSARCRGCKKQILDEISVEALGGKWHADCFCCDECGGGFGDDGRFFVREVEVELTDKEKRKGLGGMVRKFEDRAVCRGCEEVRLKNHHVYI